MKDFNHELGSIVYAQTFEGSAQMDSNGAYGDSELSSYFHIATTKDGNQSNNLKLSRW